VNGALHRILSPFDWTVVSRWARPSLPGAIFINTYLPIHSDGVTRSEVIAFCDYVLDLMRSNPGAAFLLGGDMNFDPWRNEEDRIHLYPIPPLQRCVSLLPGFLFIVSFDMCLICSFLVSSDMCLCVLGHQICSLQSYFCLYHFKIVCLFIFKSYLDLLRRFLRLGSLLYDVFQRTVPSPSWKRGPSHRLTTDSFQRTFPLMSARRLMTRRLNTDLL
jgi:hypothetical protein